MLFLKQKVQDKAKMVSEVLKIFGACQYQNMIGLKNHHALL